MVLLVGNPNVGKSVIFGKLTGSYAHVANYAGTTVEVMRGRHRSRNATVIDLPGTNSLLPDCEAEQVSRDLLLDHLGNDRAEIVLVADTKNLRRSLLLALQLGELELPMVLLANMGDEARSSGIEFDVGTLSGELGVEVLPAVATRGEGIFPLLEDGLSYRTLKCAVRYDPLIEEAVEMLCKFLPSDLPGKRGVSLMLLSADSDLRPRAEKWLGKKFQLLDDLEKHLSRQLAEPLRLSITRARLAAVDPILEKAVRQGSKAPRKWVDRFGNLAMHPGWGIPIAGLVLYGLYLFVGVLGAGTAVDFLEHTVFEKGITPALDVALRFVFPGPLEEFFVGPPGMEVGTGPGLLIGDYGLVSMAISYAIAIILPIVGFFFVAFSFLEDTGYLPRLAVVLHRFFKLIGLNGKAVLPMILGFGCDTMATMTTRTLSNRKERLITILLLALAIPCSAQLGVTLGMLAALSWVATVVWLGVGVGVLILVGSLANKIIPGRASDFIIEIPPLRRPKTSNIVTKTLARMEWYLREAVPLFALGTFVLWFLDRLAWLQKINHLAAPLVQVLLGLPGKATEAFIVGFLRRDYGAAGLYDLFSGSLKTGPISTETEIQVTVAMVTITLFVPCIANLFMIIKEQGLKIAAAMSFFIFPFAFFVGAVVNYLMRALWL